MSQKSKFSPLLEIRRTETVETKSTELTTAPQVGKKQRGRPGGQGKRVNPDYVQVTAYIPENLHMETKINLIRGGKREFSELVEELLVQWNCSQSITNKT